MRELCTGKHTYIDQMGKGGQVDVCIGKRKPWFSPAEIALLHSTDSWVESCPACRWVPDE